MAEVPEHFELVEQAIGTPELVDLLGRRPRRFRSRRANMSWQPEPPALLLCPPARSARARVAMECVRVSSVVSDRFLKVVPVIERPGAKGGGVLHQAGCRLAPPKTTLAHHHENAQVGFGHLTPLAARD